MNTIEQIKKLNCAIGSKNGDEFISLHGQVVLLGRRNTEDEFERIELSGALLFDIVRGYIEKTASRSIKMHLH